MHRVAKPAVLPHSRRRPVAKLLNVLSASSALGVVFTIPALAGQAPQQEQSQGANQPPPPETVIIQGGGDTWGGIGEPTICVAAPAVLNAYYKATGKRYRTLPLKNHGIEMV